MSAFKAFLRDERGATAVEYGLIAGLISLVIIGAAAGLGRNLVARFTSVSNNLT